MRRGFDVAAVAMASGTRGGEGRLCLPHEVVIDSAINLPLLHGPERGLRERDDGVDLVTRLLLSDALSARSFERYAARDGQA